jgi:segregation and condensation protein B
MENPNLDNIVLALLFASDEPLSARKIAAIVEDVTAADVKQAIDAWNQRADAEAWSIGIEQVAGGYRLATRAEYAQYVSRLYAGRRKFRLSRAGLESLAIIAYKQPITRAEIEAIRGVGCGSVIANLLERSLVEIVGKAKVLGAPFLYGTTQEFLEYLGLNSIRDLPSLEDLEALLAREAEGAVEGDEAPVRSETADADSDDEAMDAAAPATPSEPEHDGDTAGPVASGAMLGVLVDEPVNRPLYTDRKRPGSAKTETPAVSDDDEPADDEADGYRE